MTTADCSHFQRAGLGDQLMFTTYLGIEERMDREGWSEDDELIESACRQLSTTESEEG